MTTSKKRIAARFVAIAAAVGLSFGAFALNASAEPQPDEPVDTTQQGSLTVHKYRGAEKENPSEEDLLDGVEFKVTQVGQTIGDAECEAIDLTTVEGWEAASDLFGPPAREIGDEFCLVGETKIKGTAGGLAKFDLSVGVYYVEEGEDNGGNNIVEKAQPFYVAIPMPDGQGGWNYDVVVKPKNLVVDQPVKTIKDRPSALVIGSDVTWTITSVVPTLVKSSDTFTEASIVDTLDRRLSLKETSVKVGEAELTEGTHYEVTGNVEISFLEAGLLLLDVNQGKMLTVEITTTVTALADDDLPPGVISNQADVTFNGTERPTGEPYTYWGGLTVTKVDSKNDSTLLAGAEFAIYELVGTECPAEVPGGTPVVASATTGTDGLAKFDGLWIENSNTPLTDPSKDYCLYETKAPVGYNVAEFTHKVTINVEGDAIAEVTVENPQRSGPQLPMTGSMGTVALTATGLGFVVLGFVVMAAARTRRLGSLS